MHAINCAVKVPSVCYKWTSFLQWNNWFYETLSKSDISPEIQFYIWDSTFLFHIIVPVSIRSLAVCSKLITCEWTLCHKNLKIRLTASQVCNSVKPYLIRKSGFIFEDFFYENMCGWGTFCKFVQMLHAPTPLTTASVQRSSGSTRNTTHTPKFW